MTYNLNIIKLKNGGSMCHRNRKEKMEEKNWEEMQKYKEFDKENFKGIEKFSKIFSRIFNFFRFSTLGICIIAIVLGLIIYLSFVANLNARYLWFIRLTKILRYSITLVINRKWNKGGFLCY